MESAIEKQFLDEVLFRTDLLLVFAFTASINNNDVDNVYQYW